MPRRRTLTTRPRRRRLAAPASAALLAVAAVSGVARGDVIALYDFADASPNSHDGDPHSVASAFTPASGVSGGGVIPSAGSPPPSQYAVTLFSNLDAAKQGNAYFSTTLAPAPGRSVSLSAFALDLAAQSGADAPYTVQVSVLTNLDNFATPLYFNLATDPAADGAPGPFSSFTNTAPAANPLYQNVTTPIEFRYYVFGNHSASLFLDNVRIEGVTAPVPEPSAVLPLAALLSAAAGRRRRRTPRPG